MSAFRKSLPAGILVIVAAVSSCAAAPGELGDLQRVAQSCPKNHVVAEFVADDFSGSGRNSELFETRIGVIDDLLRRAVVCEGTLRVVAFSSSTSASEQIFDGSFKLDGATQIAKLRKAPKVIDSTLSHIKARLKEALKTVPNSGSDPIGIADLASEYIQQLNAKGHSQAYRLDANILTDGVQNAGRISFSRQTFTVEAATRFAAQVSASPLPKDSTLTYSGIGKAAGKPLPSDFVRALKTFYTAFCIRTGAGHCSVVTDYTAEEQ